MSGASYLGQEKELDCCSGPKSKVNNAFQLEIKVQESGRKVKRYEVFEFWSVMIRGAMSSAGGCWPTVFYQVQSQCGRLPADFKVFYAPIPWQALWSCWFPFASPAADRMQNWSAVYKYTEHILTEFKIVEEYWYMDLWMCSSHSLGSLNPRVQLIPLIALIHKCQLKLKLMYTKRRKKKTFLLARS